MWSTHLRNAVTRALLPLSWRIDAQHAARTLKRFSEVEFDSAWQYLNALGHTETPKMQLMLFENLLEEMEHSDGFLEVAHQLARERFQGGSGARSVLVKSADDIPYFLAFAHESEKSICAQFNGYARACSHLPAAAEVFRGIAIDEAKHEREARASLLAAVGSETTVRRLVWQVKFKKAYASWLRGSRHIGDAIFALWLGAVYLLFGPLLRSYCAARLAKHTQVHVAEPAQNPKNPLRPTLES